jgi:hypothetical protein
MRIEIATSGGFAAIPGLNSEASIDLAGATAQVSEKASGYTRTLSPAETQNIRGMIDPNHFFKLPAELQASSSSAADMRQIDITVHLDDGRTHTIRTSEGMSTELSRTAPGLGQLLEWSQKEFNSIREYKVQQR